jgi:hypothetical protein
VLVQRRQCFLRECAQIRVLSGIRLLLEELDIFLVVLNHLLHVGLIELGVRKLLQRLLLLLGIFGKFLRQVDALLLRDRHQLLVRFPVVVDSSLGSA